MPGTTITISGPQRDGLYELVRNHLGSVGDLWDALERDKDFSITSFAVRRSASRQWNSGWSPSPTISIATCSSPMQR